MSLDVEVRLQGQLENPRNRDLAEHVCKLVREAVRKAADDTPGSRVTITGPMENRTTTEARRFDGFDTFEGKGSIIDRRVVQHAYVHLPDPVAEAPAPDAPDQP